MCLGPSTKKNRQNLPWHTRETRNLPVNTVNIEICWRTLQFRGSLPEDTVPIILFNVQRQKWEKCLKCPRLHANGGRHFSCAATATSAWLPPSLALTHTGGGPHATVGAASTSHSRGRDAAITAGVPSLLPPSSSPASPSTELHDQH